MILRVSLILSLGLLISHLPAYACSEKNRLYKMQSIGFHCRKDDGKQIPPQIRSIMLLQWNPDAKEIEKARFQYYYSRLDEVMEDSLEVQWISDFTEGTAYHVVLILDFRDADTIKRFEKQRYYQLARELQRELLQDVYLVTNSRKQDDAGWTKCCSCHGGP